MSDCIGRIDRNDCFLSSTVNILHMSFQVKLTLCVINTLATLVAKPLGIEWLSKEITR